VLNWIWSIQLKLISEVKYHCCEHSACSSHPVRVSSGTRCGCRRGARCGSQGCRWRSVQHTLLTERRGRQTHLVQIVPDESARARLIERRCPDTRDVPRTAAAPLVRALAGVVVAVVDTSDTGVNARTIGFSLRLCVVCEQQEEDSHCCDELR